MRELTINELDQVSGARSAEQVAKGLITIGTAVAAVGGAMALVPGGQIPGFLVALDGALLAGMGGGIQLLLGFC
jgi:hypothetical protein